MKAKYLIIASLILAILTIGAVSASDDIADDLTANDDSGDKIAAINDDDAVQDSGDDKVSAEDGDVLEDVNASDFKAEMVTDEINMDDEDYGDETVFSFYCPNGTEGNCVYTVYEDSEGYECDGRYINIGSDDIGTYKNITFSDLSIFRIGLFDLKVYYSYYDSDAFDDVELTIASGTLNVTKTLSEYDFGYSINTYYNAWDVNDDYVLDLYSIPCDGTLIVYVNGTQEYSKDLDYEYFDEEFVDVDDLGITEYGDYEIQVKFQPVSGDEVNITSFDLTYYYLDEGGDDDVRAIVYDFVDLDDPSSYLGLVQDYIGGIVGTVTVYINNNQVYAKTFTVSDGRYSLYFDVSDLKLASYARGKYNVNITYKKQNGEVKSDQKMVDFTVLPQIIWANEMTVGENAGVIISGPKGTSGSVTLYNAVDDGEYGYKKGSVFATVSIVDGYARISLSKLAEGHHMFYLDYTIGGFSYVCDPEEWDSVSVYQKDTRFASAVSQTSVAVGGNVDISLTGPASAYDEVYIKVDGRTVKSIMTFTGSLKETVTGLTLGTHYVTVMLSGSTFYSNTFEVKVSNPAPAKKADVIKLTLKKVKVKKSAKKLVLQATLKINGKAVKGKVIKFKFNKKTYKAKTNKKGVAKVTVKKAVLKKLKVGKKVKIQATYGKTTKKLTVKVKK